MMTYDFTPFYRSTIGFDRMARFLENATRVADVDNPPYNIEAIGDEHYRVTLAVAGFSRDELDLQIREDTLHVLFPDPTSHAPGLAVQPANHANPTNARGSSAAC